MKFVKYILGFVLITYSGFAQKVIIADSLMAKVTQLYQAGDYGKAIELCKKAENFYRFKNDFNHVAALQVDVSTLYYTQGNVELALQTLKNGVEYWKKQNNPNSDTTLFRLYSAMGLMHNIAFRYDSSAFYYEKGEVLKKKNPKRILALDGAYSFFVNQGTIQAEFRDFEKSNYYFHKALLLPKSATRTNDEVVLNGLGNNFIEVNKPKEAIGYYEKAFNESINPYNKK